MAEPDNLPAPDVKRQTIEDLNLAIGTARQIIDNPGPLIGADGKAVTDPATGKPLPDNRIVLAAIERLLEANLRICAILGIGQRSATATMSAAGIRAKVKEIQDEIQAVEAQAGNTAKISPEQFDRVRLCIRAAELRQQGLTYRAIACELGLAFPATAMKCADTGAGFLPPPDDPPLHAVIVGGTPAPVPPGQLAAQAEAS